MLSDHVKKILNENYAGHQQHDRYVVKLPCGHCKMELPRPVDTILQCPKCYKRSIVYWSKTGKHKMEYET